MAHGSPTGRPEGDTEEVQPTPETSGDWMGRGSATRDAPASTWSAEGPPALTPASPSMSVTLDKAHGQLHTKVGDSSKGNTLMQKPFRTAPPGPRSRHCVRRIMRGAHALSAYRFAAQAGTTIQHPGRPVHHGQAPHHEDEIDRSSHDCSPE